MSEEEVRREWSVWMAHCRRLAGLARQSGEAAVGALILLDGQILGDASEAVRTSGDVTAHAELLAIRLACAARGSTDLAGCVLVTNVEPCWMCSFAIRETGIRQVVIGDPVADIGGVTSRCPLLTDSFVSGWPVPPAIVWFPAEA